MKTVDVSGFGGGYENACQAMIKVAMEFFKNEHFPSVDELEEMKSEKMLKLERKMIEATGNDCTGVMFFTSRNHAYKRVELGEEKYFEVFKDTPERIFEWDGTEESIPEPKDI